MAQSRLEKVGTIFSRINSLLVTGAMKEESKPLWFEIYRTFPPKYEPSLNRKIIPQQVKQIFYAEDLIRAKFHKEYKNYSMINMIDEGSVSRTEHFLHIYKQLQKEGIPQEELYDKAVQEFLSKIKTEKSQKEADGTDPTVPTPKYVRTTRKSHKVDDNLAKDASESTDESIENKQMYKPIRLRLDKIMSETDEPERNKKSE